jgi:hypothetical protein
LGLTIHADGRVEHDIVSASPFPRHWIYDAGGKLAKKIGVIDFKSWYTKAFGGHSPWATRTHRRWSPRWRPPWSENSHSTS